MLLIAISGCLLPRFLYLLSSRLIAAELLSFTSARRDTMTYALLMRFLRAIFYAYRLHAKKQPKHYDVPATLLLFEFDDDIFFAGPLPEPPKSGHSKPRLLPSRTRKVPQ